MGFVSILYTNYSSQQEYKNSSNYNKRTSHSCTRSDKNRKKIKEMVKRDKRLLGKYITDNAIFDLHIKNKRTQYDNYWIIPNLRERNEIGRASCRERVSSPV